MTTRAWVVAGAVLVALIVAIQLLDGDGNRSRGPRSSSYATSPRGVAAYADLLGRLGYRVRRLRTSVDERRPDPRQTVVVLDPDGLSSKEVGALTRFVATGGRLLAGGLGTDTLARRLGAEINAGKGAKTLRPAAPLPGVRVVRSAGARGYANVGAGLPLLADGASIGAFSLRSGRGEAVLLADVSPLQNRLIARDDNARLAAALTGPATRQVAFVESVHGYSEPTGFAALPGRWIAALALAALAVLLTMLARGRRLGDPEPTRRALDPPRGAYVDAVAASLARTPDRAASAGATVRAAAREALARRVALTAREDDDALRAAARTAGLDDAEAAAVLGEADLVTTGRALARLTSKERP